jgi:hypothetical protein
MEFQNYTVHQSDWVTFLIIALVFNYGLLHYLNAFNIKNILGSILSSDHSEGRETPFLVTLILNLNTLAALGLFVFSGLQFIVPDLDLDFIIFLRIIFGFLVLIGVQRLLIYMHSGMTKTTHFFANYLSIQNQFAHLAAILALPILIISLYSKWLNLQMLIAGATVFAGIYLFGIMKSIASSNRIKGPLKFHLIFYLCGNEILPFFLFYKILI